MAKKNCLIMLIREKRLTLLTYDKHRKSTILQSQLFQA